MIITYQQQVSDLFTRKAHSYEDHAFVQKKVANRFVDLLPAPLNNKPLRILEIGCGTGFLTQHLVQIYPDSTLTITDISPSMLEICASKFTHHPNICFKQMDGEHPEIEQTYDLIVSSMSFQWFHQPLLTLKSLTKLLNTGGNLIYSTLGPGCFKQWHMAIQALKLRTGTPMLPQWPGIQLHMNIPLQYPSTLDFLFSLKAIGANQPNPDYKPLSLTELKTACAYVDQHYARHMNWHIIFGIIDSKYIR